MRAFRDLAIKRKLTLVILIISGIALLMASTAFAVYDAYTFRSEMAQDLSTLAAVIGNNSTAALAFNDEGSAEEMLGALAAKPHVVRACIYSAEGGVLAKYKRADVKEDFVPPAPQADGHGFAADHLTLFQGVVLDGENIGTVYLQSDLREVDIRVKRYAGIVGIVFVASCLVVFILSFRFQRVISDPILRLARTARAVSIEKNYSVRAMKNSGDELGLLIEAFNELGLEYIPSAGNFICVDFKRPAAAMYEALLRQGVIVRPVANYGMPNHLRITIGLPEENRRFIEALRKIVRDR